MTLEPNSQAMISFFQVRVFGLIASIDAPKASDRLQLASAVIVQTQLGFVLLTVAHYLNEVKRWDAQRRLLNLTLLVSCESGILKAVPLDLKSNPALLISDLDFGMIVLRDEILSDIADYGGRSTNLRVLRDSPDDMDLFILAGYSTSNTTLLRETISTSSDKLWQLVRPHEFALLFSGLEYEQPGSSRGTHRFRLVKAADDYRGNSGGPIFAFKKGCLIRDYILFAIQSSQILGATVEQKPTHVVATSASRIAEAVDAYSHQRPRSNSEDDN